MTKDQRAVIFAAALITFRGLPRNDPNRTRIEDALRAFVKEEPVEIAVDETAKQATA